MRSRKLVRSQLGPDWLVPAILVVLVFLWPNAITTGAVSSPNNGLLEGEGYLWTLTVAPGAKITTYATNECAAGSPCAVAFIVVDDDSSEWAGGIGYVGAPDQVLTIKTPLLALSYEIIPANGSYILHSEASYTFSTAEDTVTVGLLGTGKMTVNYTLEGAQLLDFETGESKWYRPGDMSPVAARVGTSSASLAGTARWTTEGKSLGMLWGMHFLPSMGLALSVDTPTMRDTCSGPHCWLQFTSGPGSYEAGFAGFVDSLLMRENHLLIYLTTE